MFENSNQQIKTYRSIFKNNSNGRDILNDLKTAFCISPIVKIGYTQKPELDLAIREGLRIAYEYIQSNLIEVKERNDK